MSAVTALAFELADETARADIECIGRQIEVDDLVWYDLSAIDPDDERPTIERALRYLQARGDDLPFREIHHPAYPFLRRFEERR